MTYNIRSMRDDRAALARVIRGCQPDVACIQEAPRFLRSRSLCVQLARSSGLEIVTGGRAAGAMLLLVNRRIQVEHRLNVRLQKTFGLHQRGLALAVLEVQGTRFGIASMHLSLNDTERTRQVGEVHDYLQRLGVPNLVLAGDVNESPSGPNWRALTAKLTDAHAAAPWGGEFTSTAVAPRRRIDGVFVSSTIQVVRCGVPEQLPGIAESDLVRATDHLPVVADLLLPASSIRSS